MESLQYLYPDEFSTVERLIGKKKLISDLSRLNEIYYFSEEKYDDYVKKLCDREVKYLIIAEAPPWSTSDRPQYFYDEQSRARTLMRALKKVFKGTNDSNMSASSSLQLFADNGLLLIDTIPFALDYTSLRSKRDYQTLVKQSAKSYFLNKIDEGKIICSNQLRIAFSLKRNAQALINACDGKLIADGQIFELNENMIAVNEAGYPDARKLRQIFGI